MYKELIRLVAAMIVNPGKTWKELAAKTEKGDEYLSRVVYPLIGLATLTAFVGVLFTEKTFSWEVALKSAIKTVIASFGGFFLSAYTVNRLLKKMGKGDNPSLCRRFVGYASITMYALEIALCLLPVSDFFYLRAALLYTIYVVWEGVQPYMGIRDEKAWSVSARMLIFVTASTSILIFPPAIKGILFLLMPGLRI